MKIFTLSMLSLITISTFSYSGLSKSAYTALNEYNEFCKKSLSSNDVDETFSNEKGDYLVTFSDGGSVELKKVQKNYSLTYEVEYVDCSF